MDTLQTIDLHRSTKDGSKFQPTQEELGMIMKKMEDPEFRRLWEEYASDLQDPKYREEEEAYLRQVEDEAKAGGDHSFQFVIPTEAFVVRLAAKDEKRRVYINVCSSEKIDACCETPSADGSSLSQWSIPVSVGPGREERYEGKTVWVHDAVYHPQTLHLANRSDAFSGMILSVGIENINAGYAKCYAGEHQRLPSTVRAIGRPKPQTIRLREQAAGSGAGGLSAHTEKATVHKKNTAPPVTPTPTRVPTSQANEGVRGSNDADAEVRPTYHILYREKEYDLLQAWGAIRVSDTRIGVPHQVVVKIELPRVARAVDIDVDVLPKVLVFNRCPGRYAAMQVPLPFEVDPDTVRAKFDASKKVLTVTMDVTEQRTDVRIQGEVEHQRKTFSQQAAQHEEAEKQEGSNTSESLSAPIPSCPAGDAAHVPSTPPCVAAEPTTSTGPVASSSSVSLPSLTKHHDPTVVTEKTCTSPPAALEEGTPATLCPDKVRQPVGEQHAATPVQPINDLQALYKQQDDWLQEEKRRATAQATAKLPEPACEVALLHVAPEAANPEWEEKRLLQEKKLNMERRRIIQAEKEQEHAEQMHRLKQKELPLTNKLITMLD